MFKHIRQQVFVCMQFCAVPTAVRHHDRLRTGFNVRLVRGQMNRPQGGLIHWHIALVDLPLGVKRGPPHRPTVANIMFGRAQRCQGVSQAVALQAFQVGNAQR